MLGIRQLIEEQPGSFPVRSEPAYSTKASCTSNAETAVPIRSMKLATTRPLPRAGKVRPRNACPAHGARRSTTSILQHGRSVIDAIGSTGGQGAKPRDNLRPPEPIDRILQTEEASLIAHLFFADGTVIMSDRNFAKLL